MSIRDTLSYSARMVKRIKNREKKAALMMKIQDLLDSLADGVG